MQKYYNEVIIEANIENVFEFLNGDEKNLKVIDPHILSSKLISETKEVIGSKYLQTYMQKGKTINYEITVTSYLNNKNVKGYGINFKPLKMFDLTATYRLEKLNDKETLIKYEILNKPLKLSSKMMLKIKGQSIGTKLLNEHLENIEKNFSLDNIG